DAPAHYAADGAFGTQGVVALPSNATALSLDVASNVLLARDSPDVVMRFLPQGALDPAFGQNGIAPLPFEPTALVASLAVGPTSNDTFAVAAGSLSSGIELARLDASGAPVSTFGLGGFAFTSTDVDVLPQRAIFDSAGRLWVAVRADQGGAFIARYRIVGP
ncbi:MAG TPA: hypothetical protein VGH28_06120, partial [Polyangiaceae bacterium]